MSETERRYTYAHNRVLIEAQRILNPQFDDAVVFLSGAQIELLRNVSQYLGRQATYVAEYNPGYYIAPTTEDFDSILEIVADLEETLMGNQNTIWGYKERWSEFVEWTMTEDASYTVQSAPVPNGYVYTLQSIVARNLMTTCGTVPKLYSAGATVPIGQWVASGPTIYRIEQGLNYTMKYGDEAWCRFYSCLDGDELELLLWGYKMVVPEE